MSPTATTNGSTKHTETDVVPAPNAYITPRNLLFWLIAAPTVILNIILLNKSNDEGRLFMVNIDKSLGVAIPELSYVDDCSDVMGKLIDPFVVAHLGGWFVFTLSSRDWRLTAFFFTLDELLELWWRDAYPNFSECWWDSLILDMLACNLVGALLAQWLITKLGGEIRDWFQDITTDYRRLAFFANVTVFRIAMFYSLFGFKWALWIPSGHLINVYRPIAYLLMLELALESTYNFLRYKTPIQGGHVFLLYAFAGLDLAVANKFGYYEKIVQTTSWLGCVVFCMFVMICLPSIIIFSGFVGAYKQDDNKVKSVKSE